MKYFMVVISIGAFLAVLPSSSFPKSSERKFFPGMRMGPGGVENRCRRAFDLNLSSDQAKGLDAFQQAYLRDTQLIRVELFSRSLELRDLLTNPNTKLETIRAKSGEIAEFQAKLDEKTIEYLLKVRNLLTPEQLKSWCPEEEIPLFRRMMLPPGPMGPPFPYKRRFREEGKTE